MQSYPDKDPADYLPYSMTFLDEVGSSIPISPGSSVIVEKASGGAETSSLVVSDVSVVASGATPDVLDTVIFWLSGGTNKTTYVLKGFDPTTGAQDPALARRAALTVANQ